MSKPLIRTLTIICIAVNLAMGNCADLLVYSGTSPDRRSVFAEEALALTPEFELHSSLRHAAQGRHFIETERKALFDAEDGIQLFGPQTNLVRELIRDRQETMGRMLERLDMGPQDDLPTRLEKVRRFRDMLEQDEPIGGAAPDFLQTLRKKYGRGWPAPLRQETDRPSCLDNLDDYVAILETPSKDRNSLLADIADDQAAIGRALHIFYDEYIFDMIQLAVPRICEQKDLLERGRREKDIDQLLKDLEDPEIGASGQTFDVSVPTLMALLGSSLAHEELPYIDIARQYPGRVGNSVSAHLRTLLRRVYPKTESQFNQSIKKNSLDFALQILHLSNRLKDYETLKARPVSDPSKQNVVEDLLNFVAAHPYLMTDIN